MLCKLFHHPGKHPPRVCLLSRGNALSRRCCIDLSHSKPRLTHFPLYPYSQLSMATPAPSTPSTAPRTFNDLPREIKLAIVRLVHQQDETYLERKDDAGPTFNTLHMGTSLLALRAVNKELCGLTTPVVFKVSCPLLRHTPPNLAAYSSESRLWSTSFLGAGGPLELL